MTIHNSANMGSPTEFSSGGGLFRFEDFDFRRQPDVPVSDSDRLATLFKTQSRMEDPIGESQTLTGSTLRESQTVTRPTMDHQLHYLNRQAAEFGAQMSQRYSEIARSELISNILADLEHLRRIHEMIAGSRGKPLNNPMNEGVILTVLEPAKPDPSHQQYNLLERLTRGQRLRSKKEERTSENLDGMLSKSQGRELDKPAKVRGPGGTSEKSLLRELLDKMNRMLRPRPAGPEAIPTVDINPVNPEIRILQQYVFRTVEYMYLWKMISPDHLKQFIAMKDTLELASISITKPERFLTDLFNMGYFLGLSNHVYSRYFEKIVKQGMESKYPDVGTRALY
ncbi:hypothetical protein PSTG_10220 [Puccinia striiformis f. sp. tritici PST-78]|uniref:Uncharacterized protein n=1 Tax=Puccinia striiformis f. sp. tritici PST-78 TaxID=1165861 RepID=A0A0L0VB81_9BASI|nr:hypothetical protein PSTG_10220 [Puccinia striiformis f. sp. tritici PST-78]